MAKLLLIDDDPFFLKTMSAVLEKAGHQVITADGGAAGLQILQTESPDIMICDIFMPDKDGFEVAMEAMRQKPAMKRIMISGGGDRADMKLLTVMQDTLADVILTKPVNAEQLLDTVQTCC